jgi:virginiamycin A acetyltransferase
MIYSLWSLFLQKIKSGLRSTNSINIKTGGVIHSSAKIKEAILKGRLRIHENCRIIDGVTINANSEVVINKYTTINGPGTDINASIHPVLIGRFCSIARYVTIQEYNHPINRMSSYFINKNYFNGDIEMDIESKGPIIIGNDVWIGAQCVILSGVKIGDGAIIAANSVVTSEVPPYAIVSGSPAKVVKYRFSEEIINKLLSIKWWDWPDEKMRFHRHLFQSELTLESLELIK